MKKIRHFKIFNFFILKSHRVVDEVGHIAVLGGVHRVDVLVAPVVVQVEQVRAAPRVWGIQIETNIINTR